MFCYHLQIMIWKHTHFPCYTELILRVKWKLLNSNYPLMPWWPKRTNHCSAEREKERERDLMWKPFCLLLKTCTCYLMFSYVFTMFLWTLLFSFLFFFLVVAGMIMTHMHTMRPRTVQDKQNGRKAVKGFVVMVKEKPKSMKMSSTGKGKVRSLLVLLLWSLSVNLVFLQCFCSPEWTVAFWPTLVHNLFKVNGSLVPYCGMIFSYIN